MSTSLLFTVGMKPTRDAATVFILPFPNRIQERCAGYFHAHALVSTSNAPRSWALTIDSRSTGSAHKKCRIGEQHGCPGCEEQKVGHFYCVGVMHADAPLAEYGREKQDFVREAAQKDAVHPAAI
jgi:hypothetical protein